MPVLSFECEGDPDHVYIYSGTPAMRRIRFGLYPGLHMYENGDNRRVQATALSPSFAFRKHHSCGGPGLQEGNSMWTAPCKRELPAAKSIAGGIKLRVALLRYSA